MKPASGAACAKGSPCDLATRVGATAALEKAPDLPREYGRYQLFDLIGRGGMAEIYLARATTELGIMRRVVLKQILPELSGDSKFAEMLAAEARLAAQLTQRNVVQVFDLGTIEGKLFIAMEYVEGYDLNRMLGRLSRAKIGLPPDFALFIVCEVLAGLDYAHRATDEHGEPLGVVHRDVSPSNVLTSFEGEVKLCDFGIARAFERVSRGGDDAERDVSAVMQQVRVAGKSGYMAPEQARDDAVDSRSDVFVAGVLCWELCAGRRLYTGTEEQKIEAAKAGSVKPLPKGRLPRQHRLQSILDRALSVDPARRFQTAGAMREALEQYAIDVGLMASQLRFARFLSEHFAESIVTSRRERERGAEQTFSPKPRGRFDSVARAREVLLGYAESHQYHFWGVVLALAGAALTTAWMLL